MKTRAFLLLTAFSALVFASCDHGFSGDSEPVYYSKLRIAQLAPDSSGMKIWLDDHLIAERSDFREFTDYGTIADGDHRFSVAPYTSGITPQMLVDVTVPVAGDVSYTVMMTGVPGDYGAVLLEDQRETSDTMAQVRFVHAAPDAPPMEVALESGEIILPSTAYRENSPYLALTPGSPVLRVRNATTHISVATLQDFRFFSDTNYSLYLTGRAGNSSLTVTAVMDGDNPPLMYP